MQNQLDENTRIWGMTAHLAALIGLALPFAPVIIALTIWLKQKEKHPFIDEQGKESVNFQLSIAIYLLAMVLLFIFIIFMLRILPFIFRNYWLLDLLILMQQSIFFCISFIIGLQTITTLMAGVRAYNGQSYRYPLNLRLLR